jgi:hypothetical protein
MAMTVSIFWIGCWAATDANADIATDPDIRGISIEQDIDAGPAQVVHMGKTTAARSGSDRELRGKRIGGDPFDARGPFGWRGDLSP